MSRFSYLTLIVVLVFSVRCGSEFEPPTEFKELSSEQNVQFQKNLAGLGLVMNAFYNGAAAKTSVSNSHVLRLDHIDLFTSASSKMKRFDILGLNDDKDEKDATIGNYQQFVNRISNAVDKGTCKRSQINDFETSGNIFTFWSLPNRDIGHSITGPDCPVRLEATGKIESNLEQQNLSIVFTVDYESKDDVLTSLSGIKTFHQEWRFTLNLRTGDDGQVASGDVFMNGIMESQDGEVEVYVRGNGTADVTEAGSMAKASGEVKFGMVFDKFPAEMKVLADQGATGRGSRGVTHFINGQAAEQAKFEILLDKITKF